MIKESAYIDFECLVSMVNERLSDPYSEEDILNRLSASFVCPRAFIPHSAIDRVRLIREGEIYREESVERHIQHIANLIGRDFEHPKDGYMEVEFSRTL